MRPGFSPDSFPLNMGNLESHLLGEPGLKFMPVAVSADDLILV
jgi:hypothetical protein